MLHRVGTGTFAAGQFSGIDGGPPCRLSPSLRPYGTLGDNRRDGSEADQTHWVSLARFGLEGGHIRTYRKRRAALAERARLQVAKRRGCT